jgi:hypothetical protein
LWEYGGYDFDTVVEDRVEAGTSKVDYVGQVNGEDKALCEAKSPSVMAGIGELLPLHRFELHMVRGQSLVPKFFGKVSTYFLFVRVLVS